MYISTYMIFNFCLYYFCRRSRWFILPWLIYAMLMVVGLSLAAVLFIVIPLGTYSHNWPWEITKTCISLSSAGLYLYFWIVVLELFIKMVPMPMIFDPAFGGPVPPPLPPGKYTYVLIPSIFILMIYRFPLYLY